MKRNLILLSALCWLAPAGLGAVPPAEKLLPADTLGLVTVPDWDAARKIYGDSPIGQLWADPAMKAFKDKFLEKVKTDLITPLERELDIKLADYADLVHGQVTLAFTKLREDNKTNAPTGWVLLVDTKEKMDLLRKQLADVKKKWVDAGKPMKTETIRGIEFATLILNSDDLGKTLDKALQDPQKAKKPNAAAAPKKAPEKIELTVGQSDSLLILGTVPGEIEKILIRQSGGLVPALAEQADFEANSAAMFRSAFVYGWLNFKPIHDMLVRPAADEDEAPKAANPFTPKMDKILAATGLSDLKTVAFHVTDTSEGPLANVFLGVPEAKRRGIFKILLGEAKDAAPPPFVPADTVKFTRWRGDGKKVWATIEAVLTDISPEIGGILQMSLAAAGKDKDENFDLKKTLIGNLGDDLICFQKNPRSATLANLNSPPTLYLVGSPNSEQLAIGLKVGASLMPPPMNIVKDREFRGRTIYALKMAPAPNPDGPGRIEKNLSFAASGGYLALSTDEAMLEEYLRSSENSGKALRETAGLNDAAQKVGGMGTGWFTYENQSETVRAALEVIRQKPEAIGSLFSGSTLTQQIPLGTGTKGAKDWFDAGLLPAFEKIAKYLNYTVSAVSSQPDGLNLKTFFPAPPQLKK